VVLTTVSEPCVVCCTEHRTGKNVILASSDVSARGMDYPDVTFVLQVGMTDRDQYIHR
jgi:ATP-dependent RNA helicase MSS116